MAIQYLSGGILNRTNSAEQGSGSLLDLPYDMGWVAGYTDKWVAEDITVRTYGEGIMPRSGEFIDDVGIVNTGSTGAVIIVDVLKNGTSIYSTKPQFATGTAGMTGGTFSTPTTFLAGDRITFKVTQVGSTVAGNGLRFALKSRV